MEIIHYIDLLSLKKIFLKRKSYISKSEIINIFYSIKTFLGVKKLSYCPEKNVHNGQSDFELRTVGLINLIMENCPGISRTLSFLLVTIHINFKFSSKYLFWYIIVNAN